MNYVVSNVLFFFYIYSIKFFFFPISTRVLFGVIGFILFCVYVATHKKNHLLSKYFLMYIFSLFLIFLATIVTVTINATHDFEFVRYCISMLTLIFSSYFLCVCLNKLLLSFSFFEVSKLLVNVIFLQSIIAILMFLFPFFKEFALGIQSVPPSDIVKLSLVSNFRIVGFGTYFFGAGVISGFSLIVIGILLKYFPMSKFNFNFLVLKFLFILIIGLMMARTTLIGALIGIVIIIVPDDFKMNISKNAISRLFYFLFLMFVLPLVFFSVFIFVFPDFQKLLKPLYNFAFEMIFNYLDGNGLQSDSTNHLMTMYIFPDNYLSWIIGDGFWLSPNGSGYYMGSDVGLVRLIFYFGLFGTTMFYIMQFFIIYNAFFILNKFVVLAICIFLFSLNLKGFTDLTPLVLIYWMSSLLFNKKFNLR